VSGCVPTVNGTTHSFAGFADTYDCKLSVDEAYLFLAGYDTNSGDSKVIKVRIADWAVVASQGFSDAYYNTDDMRVSPDGLHLYVAQNGSGNTVDVFQLAVSDLSIEQTATIGTGSVNSYYAGGLDLSADGSELFVTWVKSSDSHGHLARVHTADFTFEDADVSSTSYTYTTIAAKDNTHVFSADTTGTGNLDVITMPGGAISTLMTLSSTNFGYSTRIKGTKLALGGQDATPDSYAVIVDTTIPSEISAVTGDVLNDSFESNSVAWADSTHAYFASSRSDDPSPIYRLTAGDSSFDQTLTLASPNGEYEGVAPLADGSHVYAGIDGDQEHVADLLPPSLTLAIPAGIAYSGGNRVTPSAVVAHTFTASKDTYLSVSSAGAYLFNEVDNGDPQPTITGLLIAKVVSDGTKITGVVDLSVSTPTVSAALPAANIITVSADYTVSDGFGSLLVVARNASPITLTLPNPATTHLVSVSINHDNGDAANTITLAATGGSVDGIPVITLGETVTLIPDSVNGRWLQIAAPGSTSQLITVDTNQDVSGVKTFLNGKFRLKDVADNNYSGFDVAAQTGSALVNIPDLSGVAQTLMVLGPIANAVVTGDKFFNNGTLKVTTGGDQSLYVQITTATQTAPATVMFPDLGGGGGTFLFEETINPALITAGAVGNFGNTTITAWQLWSDGTLRLKPSSGTNNVTISALNESTAPATLYVPDLNGVASTIAAVAPNAAPSPIHQTVCVGSIISGGPSFVMDASAPMIDGGALTGTTVLTQTSAQRYTVSGTFTVSLPDPTTLGNGASFRFKNIGAGVITFDVTGGSNIDGAATKTSVVQWECLTFQIIDGAWYVVEKF
jgi:hypothetical protein